MTLKLKVLGIPIPKQSARFKRAGNTIISYQTSKVKNNERNLAFDIKSQLPRGFKPFNGPIGAKVTFVFPPLKSFSKKKIKALEEGETIYKDTKPDLDNLKKMLWDALQGVVMVDDSRVCKVESKKIYGMVPRTEIELLDLAQKDFKV